MRQKLTASVRRVSARSSQCMANPESERQEALESAKKDLMNSKIINRAACLAELTRNPKSFSNCPDLHGGVPDLPGGSRPREMASIARSGFGRIRARQQ